MAEPASMTGQILNQTTRVLARVARVSAPSAISSAAALRYTHARTSAGAPPATVAAMTTTATSPYLPSAVWAEGLADLSDEPVRVFGRKEVATAIQHDEAFHGRVGAA